MLSHIGLEKMKVTELEAVKDLDNIVHIRPACGHSIKFQIHVRILKNLGHRLKISFIGHNNVFHSILLQILPNFDVNNIDVAQKLTKWHHFQEVNRNSFN